VRRPQVLTDLLRFNMPNLVQLQLTHMGVMFVMDRCRLPHTPACATRPANGSPSEGGGCALGEKC
jgi:hypothetical protein